MPASASPRQAPGAEVTVEVVHFYPLPSSSANQAGTVGNFGTFHWIGQYAANPWGFFDMHGNVWEWTADWYQAGYPTGNPVIDPTGPASGSARVMRGGPWYSGVTGLRSAMRSANPPSYLRFNLGFRVGFQQQ